MERISMNGRALPVALFIVCLPPTAFGSFTVFTTLGENSWGLIFAPDQVDHLPLAIHAAASALFLCLGALQVWPSFRIRHMRWHRRAGRIAFVAGVLGAASGLWLTLIHASISGPVHFWGRVLASAFWMLALIAAIYAISRSDIRKHQRWMIRAYAIAVPAGSLVFILFPLVLIFGEEGNDLMFEIVQTAAWPIHLAVAEWIMRRGRSKSTHPKKNEVTI